MSKRFVYVRIRLPSPVAASRYSLASIPISDRATACRTPVIVYGSVYGMITCRQSCRSFERYDCATSTRSALTLRAPSTVLMRMGQTPNSVTTITFARNSNPNSERMNGISANIGVA